MQRASLEDAQGYGDDAGVGMQGFAAADLHGDFSPPKSRYIAAVHDDARDFGGEPDVVQAFSPDLR